MPWRWRDTRVKDRQTTTARLERLYARYLDAGDVAQFIERVTAAYLPGTLARLAVTGSRLARRGAVTALGLTSDFECNAMLGRALRDSDRGVRILAEGAIRNVWRRDGAPAERDILSRVIRLNVAGRFDEAALLASKLLVQAARFAEGWNQRALAHFGNGDFARAVDDFSQALVLNPFHFDAARGLGQVYLRRGEYVPAMASFQRALDLNMDLEDARIQIRALARVANRKSR